MPTYQHICTNEFCNNEFELFYGINDPVPTKCERCGQDTVKRVISDGSSFVLAGSGWARDSYNGNSNHK